MTVTNWLRQILSHVAISNNNFKSINNIDK